MSGLRRTESREMYQLSEMLAEKRNKDITTKCLCEIIIYFREYIRVLFVRTLCVSYYDFIVIFYFNELHFNIGIPVIKIK